MSGITLKVVEPDPNDPLGDLRSHLVMFEQGIAKSDAEALRCRWKSGHYILKLRKGARLPNNVLTALHDDLGVSRREVQHRMKFAEVFTEQQLCNALHSFGSWHEIVRCGLYAKTAKAKADKPTTLPVSTLCKAATDRLVKAAASRPLRPVDVKAIDALIAMLTELRNSTK